MKFKLGDYVNLPEFLTFIICLILILIAVILDHMEIINWR